MQARVKAGWVKEEDIAKPAADEAEVADEATTETEQAQA